jgi:hypothetical protein
LIGAAVLRANMDISARATLWTDRPATITGQPIIERWPRAFPDRPARLLVRHAEAERCLGTLTPKVGFA